MPYLTKVIAISGCPPPGWIRPYSGSPSSPFIGGISLIINSYLGLANTGLAESVLVHSVTSTHGVGRRAT